MGTTPHETCTACGAPLPGGPGSRVCPVCLLGLGLEGEPLEAEGITAPPPAPPAGGPLPQSLGDYDLLEELGRGGMGIVYRARHRPLDRLVAVKLLLVGRLASPESLERFRTEARTAARLRHPHIVATHDFGVIDGQPFLVLDLIEGPHLGTLVRERPLTPERAARYLRAIAGAVHYAHGQGILHRDLKPSNIVIDGDDEPRLTDFGLAKQLGRDSDLTVTGQAIGSPGYMAPEQAAGRPEAVGPRTDVYALGAILYHLLVGRPPFLAPSLTSALRQIFEDDPVAPRRLNPTIPRDLETLCLRCLDKQPERRPASAGELADELDRFLSGTPIRSRPPALPERFVRWSRRNPRIALLAAITTVLSLALLAGIPLAGLRIDRERRAALLASDTARQQEQAAQTALHRLELERAEDQFARDDAAGGLATLAAVLRGRPDDRIAATRLVNELTHRSFARPVMAPLVHEEPVHGVEVSPDGRRLLTVTRDNRAHLWDLGSGHRLASLPHDPEIVHAGDFNEGLHPITAAFSPDGRLVATASFDRTARIWEAETGHPQTPPLAHPDAVVEVRFAPDARLLAAACRDGSILLWNVATGLPASPPRRHDDWVNAIRFTPDGRFLLSASDDRTARLWNLAEPGPAQRLFRHGQAVRDAMPSPDGTRLATATAGTTARIWDAGTGEMLGEAMRHGTRLNTLAYSPDGSRLATTSADRTARIWDASTGLPVGKPLVHQGNVRTARFSPDGGRLVTTSEDRVARVWDAWTGEPLGEPIRHRGAVWSADFTPDGARIATASSDRRVQLWDVRPARAIVLDLHGYRRPIRTLWSTNRAVFAAVSLASVRLLGPTNYVHGSFRRSLSHDSDLVTADLTANGRYVVSAALDGTVVLWATDTGQRLAGPFRDQPRVQAVRFDPGGTRFASAGADGTVILRSVPEGLPAAESVRQSQSVFALDFDADGTLLATAGGDRTARTYLAATGAESGPPLVHDDEVTLVRFAPDARHLLTVTRNGPARVWDLRTRVPLGGPLDHDGGILDAAFDPEGRHVATAGRDGIAHLWDAATGRPIGEPMVHQATIRSLEFDPAGNRLTTASEDGSARIWDARTGFPLASAFRSDLRTLHAGFDPDGRRLATSDGDYHFRVLDLPELPAPIPRWLPELAEAVAALRLDERRRGEAVPAERLLALRERLLALPDSAPGMAWCRWFLADPQARAMSPSAPQTVADWLDMVHFRSIPDGNSVYLPEHRRAVSIAPDHAPSLLALARTLAGADPRPTPQALGEAEWLSRHAVDRWPDLPEAWWTRAIVLGHAGRPAEALPAIDAALRLDSRDGYFRWTRARLLAQAGRAAEADAAFASVAEQLGRPDWQGRITLRDVRLEWAEYLDSVQRPAEARALRLAARGIPPRPPDTSHYQVDLSAYYNGGLDTPWLGGPDGESLGALPWFSGRFGKVEFDVRGVVQLGSKRLDQDPPGYPGRIEGIPVGLTGLRLQILHATTGAEIDGTLVATYVVHLADGSRSEIPVTYGRDLLDWTLDPSTGDTANPRPVWSGPGRRNPSIHLYRTTWTNPRPDLEIRSLDLVSRGTRSGPFVLAVTVEPASATPPAPPQSASNGPREPCRNSPRSPPTSRST